MNKNVLITGASSGLGRQIAIDMSNRGYNVYITGRNIRKLKETAAMMNKEFFAELFSIDLSSNKELNSLCQKDLKIDILINAAGLFPNGLLEETCVKTFDEAFAVNVRAPFVLMKNFIPYMRSKKWGRVVNIGSSSAYAGYYNTSVYCATKHALLGLSRSAFNECKEDNIRVINVSPGSIKTPMGEHVKNQDYNTFIEPTEASKFILDLIEYNGNMICEEVRINRMFVQ